MVMLGQTTSATSEKRESPRALTLLRMLHAASIPITVVLPLPVAILQAQRVNPTPRPPPPARRAAPGEGESGQSRGMEMPCRRSARASVRKMMVSAASRWAKNSG